MPVNQKPQSRPPAPQNPPEPRPPKRPLFPSVSDSAGKRTRLEEPVLPRRPRASSQVVPEQVIFALVGSLPPVDADYLRLWKDSQDYSIALYHDPGSLFAEELKKVIVEQVNRLDEFQRRGPFFGDDDVFRYRVVQARQKAFDDIVLEAAKNNDWGQAVKDWLLKANAHDPGYPTRLQQIETTRVILNGPGVQNDCFCCGMIRAASPILFRLS